MSLLFFIYHLQYRNSKLGFFKVWLISQNELAKKTELPVLENFTDYKNPTKQPPQLLLSLLLYLFLRLSCIEVL